MISLFHCSLFHDDLATSTVKNLVGGRTYYFQVFANSATNYGASDQVKFPVPARVKHKAITAGVVGGILFFIVAIILSICAVKICNKRKRRKQEKGRAASRGDASVDHSTCSTESGPHLGSRLSRRLFQTLKRPRRERRTCRKKFCISRRKMFHVPIEVSQCTT